MRSLKLNVIATILFIFSTKTVSGQSKSVLTKDQAIGDLKILEISLQEIHPNIYRYTNKEQFDSLFKNVRDKILDSITVREFHNFVAPIVAMVRCGHTFGINSFVEPTKGFLPFDIKVAEDKILVLRNFLTNNKPSNGSEILSINGISEKDILNDLRNKQNSDGFGINFKDRIIERNFQNKYAAFIEQPDTFKIVFLDYKTKARDSILIDAMPHSFIISNTTGLDNPNVDPLNFTIEQKRNLAILKTQSFMSSSIRKQSHQNLKRFIKKSFVELKRSNVDNLILDLRGNTGGKVFATPLLFSYLTNQKFKIANKITFRHGYRFTYPHNLNRNKLNDWVNERLCKRINDSCYEWTHHKITKKTFKPKRKRFNGNLYVLINGMTASAGAELASIIKAYNRGTFIGEDSGGDFNGVNGFERTNLTLPNSRIGILIAGWHSVVAWGSGNDTGYGVPADYEIHPTIEDLLSGKDTEMEFVYERLLKK